MAHHPGRRVESPIVNDWLYGIGVGLAVVAFVLVLGFYVVVRVEKAPVSDAAIIGVYKTANWSIPNWGDGATLRLDANGTFTHSIRLKNGESHGSAGSWKFHRLTSKGDEYVVIEFAKFDLIPSFGFGASTDQWSTTVWRNWLGHVQFCYDSDVGYCYVKTE
jgi:hypothetical protein